MIRAFDVAQVRAAEETVRAGLPDGALMKRAAKGLAAVVRARLGEGARNVVVLAGAGDNGGDAMYAAKRLTKHANVVVLLVGPVQHEKAARAAQRAGALLLEWRDGAPSDDVRAALREADAVVDGILGIGGRPGLPEHLRVLPDLVDPESYVVAVDLPSGLDPEGEVPADALTADETVTFSLLKPCHLLPAGEAACGLLTVVDIGVPEPEVSAVERLEPADVARYWPVPTPFDDKYSRGVLGAMTGSDDYPGAAVLGVTAAVTAGVGLVRYVGPTRPTEHVLRAVPEAVTGEGHVQAWLLGSGWAATTGSEPLVERVLGSQAPVVLDAGALDELEEPCSGPTILTPHAGELRRLAERLDLPETSGVRGARAVADALGATVLLKGHVTVVVPPSASGLPVYSQAEAPHWTATAGAGDVLAGVIGALIAGGVPPHLAGALAALVHGRSAEHANPGGPVRALDIAHAVGPAVADLLRS